MSPRWLVLACLGIFVSSCHSGAERPVSDLGKLEQPAAQDDGADLPRVADEEVGAPADLDTPSEELGGTQDRGLDLLEGTQSCANQERELVVEAYPWDEDPVGEFGPAEEPDPGLVHGGSEPDVALVDFLPFSQGFGFVAP